MIRLTFNKNPPQIRIWWHANQLSTQNTCKRFPSEPSKWSLSLVTRLHNHGEDCWSDSCPETIIDTLTRRVSHKHSLPKKAGCSQSAVSKHVNRKLSGKKKSVDEKDAQPTERTAALWGLSSKINSRIWVNFTRNGLRLGSRHQEPPHTDVSRNLATVVVFLLLSHSWTTDNVRGVLPGLRRRRTGLLLSGPKSSFQMRASCISFGNQGPRVWRKGGEKLIAQVAWSPVLSFHSMWWFGVQCHLLVLVHCVFWKPTSLHPFTKKF